MKITFLGGGNMAQAIVGGLLREGHSALAIQIVEPDKSKWDLWHNKGLRVVGQFDQASYFCDVLVLAVKPQHMEEALRPLRGTFKDQVVLSIAAGVPLARLEKYLGEGLKLVRAMPNTPALVGHGISVLVAAALVDPTSRQMAQAVLATTGVVLWVDDEELLHAVTAISGSGPAYVFYFMEAMQAGALAMGLDEGLARRLSLETFLGASLLAHQSNLDLVALRNQVASPGGTTERALHVLQNEKVKESITTAIAAADARSRQLSKD